MFERIFKNIDDILWKDAGCGSELDYIEQTSWILFLKYLDNLEKEKKVSAELTGDTYEQIIDSEFEWEDDGIYRKGKYGCVYNGHNWVEIIPKLFTTEDGVDIYKGDKCWYVNYLFTICGGNSQIDKSSKHDLFKWFSTKKAAQEYIDKHKEKTLKDYDNALIKDHLKSDKFKWLKATLPKLYWLHILQLIADDLNGDWKWHPCVYHVRILSSTTNCGYQGVECRTGALYSSAFKSKELANKAIKLLGDKLDIIFK